MNASKLVLPVLVALSASLDAITPNAMELELARLLVNDANQLRPELVYSPVLNVVARAKAFDMAHRDFTSHADPDGYGANKACGLLVLLGAVSSHAFPQAGR